MRGGRQLKAARLNADGGFSFDDLERAEYRLRIQDGRGSGERAIDLSRLSCNNGGGDTFAERWRTLFESHEGPIEYEVRDVHITAADDVAFSHSLNRMGGTLKSGQKTNRWLRWTACYRRVNGKWLIVHEQVSVPVDVRNGKALLDLTP